jgi:hypothetical protein
MSTTKDKTDAKATAEEEKVEQEFLAKQVGKEPETRKEPMPEVLTQTRVRKPFLRTAATKRFVENSDERQEQLQKEHAEKVQKEQEEREAAESGATEAPEPKQGGKGGKKGGDED